MSKQRVQRNLGAERRNEISPFGNQELRLEWVEKIALFDNLQDALTALINWRLQHQNVHLTDQDALWIEARLEESVAVLRFEELSNDVIRSQTLTGELILDVQSKYKFAAECESTANLEKLASEFRLRYKPPIMPSSPYMKTETILSEQLMKKRSLNWFEISISNLRKHRGVKVIKEGLLSQP